MKRLILALCLAVLPAPLWAAYTTATPTFKELLPDGRIHVTVVFAGNASEPTVPREFYGSSIADLQSQVATALVSLNQARTDFANITLNQALSAPSLSSMSPTNNATGISTSPTLIWSVPGVISADVAFGTVNPPTTIVATAVTTNRYVVTPALTVNTTYFWRLRLTDSAGAQRLSPVFQFTTAPTAAGSTEQQFWADLQQFYAVNAAVAAGIVSATDTNYVALKSKVTSEFQSSFVNDSGWPR